MHLTNSVIFTRYGKRETYNLFVVCSSEIFYMYNNKNFTTTRVLTMITLEAERPHAVTTVVHLL
jgi:hypothetical protein